VDLEIDKLLTIGALRKVESVCKEYVSTIFLVPKSDGSNRLVLNLKGLNEYVFCPHFKMEDFRTVCNLITPGCYMAVVDLKDAYYAIPMKSCSKKFLRFYWKDQLFEYQCLPFGLCSAPRAFTKIIKVVLGYLRKNNLVNAGFLDDIILFGKTKLECENNIEKTKNLLQALGFIINKKKSHLEPAHH